MGTPTGAAAFPRYTSIKAITLYSLFPLKAVLFARSAQHMHEMAQISFWHATRLTILV
jgi:hypothetical protein